jgi:hypothetical protein
MEGDEVMKLSVYNKRISTMENETSLKAKILDYVTKSDWVSFAQLQRLDGFKAADGEPALEITHGDFQNIVLWRGLTQAAADALRELRAEDKIHWMPGAWVSYLGDGAVPRLPIAKRARHYAKPHWLPVFYRPGPLPA